MDIDWEVVPERFRYLRPVVELCGETRFCPYDPIAERHLSFAERATKEQLDCLAAAQSEIAKRDDFKAIRKWCREAFKNKEPGLVISGLIQGILGVIEDLSEAEVPPFCNVPFEPYEPEPMKEDEASQLPEELRYLIGPALHFGEQYYDEIQMGLFFEQASDHECEMLAALAERVRINGDWPRVLQWLNELPPEHICYNWEIDDLFHLMDLCGFKFDS